MMIMGGIVAFSTASIQRDVQLVLSKSTLHIELLLMKELLLQLLGKQN